MSQFIPERGQSRNESKAGPESHLSSEERKALQRALSFPEDLPPKFQSWILDFIAVNGLQIPISNIVGFQLYKEAVEEAQAAAEAAQVVISEHRVNAVDTVNSASYVSPSNVGPTLSSLADGEYVFWYGFRPGLGAGETGFMGLNINSAGVDSDSVIDFRNLSASVVDSAVSGAFSSTLSSGSNTVLCQYASSGLISVERRFLIAARVGGV